MESMSCAPTLNRSIRLFPRRESLRFPILLFSILLSACAGPSVAPRSVAALAPLQLEGREVSVAEVSEQINTPDLLAVDEEMRAFVKGYATGSRRSRQRLMNLHRAVRGSATLGIDYDAAAEGSAEEVFHRGTANCLSYATLFVALAREAGLKANYQWLKVRPQWTIEGERVMRRVHVNALVNTGSHDRFMVDIDPLPTSDIAGSRVLEDSDATALYHANIAMYALADERTEAAWLHSVRALQLSPKMPQLWVNLGAVYRYAGQHGEAEAMYRHALELDPGNEPAMNNLVVLYAIEGREQERALWATKVQRYREHNPYYHAWLGDRAADAQDWPAALGFYKKAVKLLPEDSRMLYSLGVAYGEVDRPAIASGLIQQAIEHATLRSDIETYKLHLQDLEAQRLEANEVGG
jgi:Flp pilus assembly protein TadD